MCMIVLHIYNVQWNNVEGLRIRELNRAPLLPCPECGSRKSGTVYQIGNRQFIPGEAHR